MRKLVISGVALMAAVTSFACGGDKDPRGGSDGTPRATMTAGAASPSGSTPGAASPGSTPPGGTPPGSAPADGNGGGDATHDDVRRIISKFIDSTFTGEYVMTSSDGDAELSGGTVTIYKDGKTSLRFDIRTQQDGEDIEMIFITSPEVTAFCMSGGAAIGIPTGDGTCFAEDPTGGFALGDLSSELEALETQDVELLESSEREIAGIDATCFRARDADGEESDICLSENGDLLHVGDSGDGSGMTATSIRGDVKDDAFTRPYALEEFP